MRLGCPPVRVARGSQLGLFELFPRLVLVLVTAAMLAACGGGPRTTSTIPPDATGVLPSGPVTATEAPGSSSAGGPASLPASPSPSAGATVPVDPSLLAVLPATVRGLTVGPVPDPTGLGDPTLVANVARIAEGFAIDPASGDFVYASVIALRPGVFSDAFFRSWRDSFDVGACSGAGGVVGHAEAQIGGRTAFIGRCAGGLLTYHVRLDGRDAIVSVSSLGQAHLGEELVAGLRP